MIQVESRFKVPPLHLSIWPQSPCSSAMLMAAKCAKRSGWEIGAGRSNFGYNFRCAHTMSYNGIPYIDLDMVHPKYKTCIRFFWDQVIKDGCNYATIYCRSIASPAVRCNCITIIKFLWMNCPTFRCLKLVGGFICDFDPYLGLWSSMWFFSWVETAR